jgi:hypothetical protein
LKRALERHLVIPLSNLIATRQAESGDVVQVDVDTRARELCFKKSPAAAMAASGTAQAYLSGNAVAA